MVVETNKDAFRNYAAKSIHASNPKISVKDARKFVNEYYKYAGGSKYKDYIENKLSKHRDSGLGLPQPHDYASRMTGYYNMKNIERHFDAHGDNIKGRVPYTYIVTAWKRKGRGMIQERKVHGYKNMLKARGEMYREIHEQYRVSVYNVTTNKDLKKSY